MEKLKNKPATLSLAFFSSLIALLFAAASFSHAIKVSDLLLQSKMLQLAENENLLRRRTEIETEWMAEEFSRTQKTRPEEALNQWVKSLLEYAQKESLVFQKIEPQGIKEMETGNELRLYLLVEGDIKKLIRFLYYLYDKDSSSRVEALTLKADEDSKKLIIQLTLAKALL